MRHLSWTFLYAWNIIMRRVVPHEIPLNALHRYACYGYKLCTHTHTWGNLYVQAARDADSHTNSIISSSCMGVCCMHLLYAWMLSIRCCPLPKLHRTSSIWYCILHMLYLIFQRILAFFLLSIERCAIFVFVCGFQYCRPFRLI